MGYPPGSDVDGASQADAPDSAGPRGQEGIEFAPPETVDLPAGTFVGEYQIEHKLGEGGMASVYAGVHPVIGKRAAVKVMNAMLSTDATAVVRFVQEARSVNQIGHPNIVDVFSFGRLPDGRCYFVMEWLPGESLYDRLSARRLSLEETLDFVDQVADALETTHEKGIIHRDLKPGNVFLVPVRGRREQVKLLDFGVAKLLGVKEPDNSHHTRTGFTVGTPNYISPEQARGKNVDHRADIYSLGVMVFEMALGRLPFIADSPIDAVRLHLTEPPPLPSALWPAIPPALEQLIVRMLAKDPSERPGLAEVRLRIAELRDTPLPFLALDENAPEPAERKPQAVVLRDHLTPLVAPLARRPIAWMRWAGVSALVIGAAGLLASGLRYRTPPLARAVSRAGSSAPRLHAGAPAEMPAASTTSASLPEPTLTDSGGMLDVRVNVDDARIELDGKLLAKSGNGARIGVREGKHQLAVTAPGRRPFRRPVSVGAGATAAVTVRLERPPQSRPRSKSSSDYLVNPFGRQSLR